MKFLISFLIWLFLFVPMVIASLIFVPIMLLLGWEGYSTPFGNFLYGRHGNSHLLPPVTLWKSYVFLCFRNPVSNWGKLYLGIPYDSPLARRAWEIHKQWGNFGLKYGWAISNPDWRAPKAKFLFRPYWRVVKSS